MVGAIYNRPKSVEIYFFFGRILCAPTIPFIKVECRGGVPSPPVRYICISMSGGRGFDEAVPLCHFVTFPPHCGGIFPPLQQKHCSSHRRGEYHSPETLGVRLPRAHNTRPYKQQKIPPCGIYPYSGIFIL